MLDIMRLVSQSTGECQLTCSEVSMCKCDPFMCMGSRNIWDASEYSRKDRCELRHKEVKQGDAIGLYITYYLLMLQII